MAGPKITWQVYEDDYNEYKWTINSKKIKSVE